MKNTYSEITDRAWELFVVYLPYLWLVLFFLAPFLIVFKISFADPIIAQPPFTPLFDWARSGTSALYITLSLIHI